MATRPNDGERIAITSGPSKWDLVIALFDGDCNSRREVIFKYGAEKNPDDFVSVVVNQLAREDGSGENWLFDGWCWIDAACLYVKGYYGIRRRDGWIEFSASNAKT